MIKFHFHLCQLKIRIKRFSKGIFVKLSEYTVDKRQTNFLNNEFNHLIFILRKTFLMKIDLENQL